MELCGEWLWRFERLDSSKAGCIWVTCLETGGRGGSDVSHRGISRFFKRGPGGLWLPPDAPTTMMASQRVELAAKVHAVDDSLLAEAVARHGGYEEVEAKALWNRIANAVGWSKEGGDRLRERYEDMLRYTAEVEENDEAFEALEQEHEVEDILDVSYSPLFPPILPSSYIPNLLQTRKSKKNRLHINSAPHTDRREK